MQTEQATRFSRKHSAVLMLIAVMLLLLTSCNRKQAGSVNALSSWTEGAQAKTELTAYIADITKEGGENYIPVRDRIAVFDLDGTLMCETYPRCFEYMVFVDYVQNHPELTENDEIRKVAQEIIDTRWQEKPSGISTRQAAAAAIAYAGMTPAELEDYAKGFMESEAEGFTGLKRGEAFYKPMVEVVDLLKANDFTIYIVTATERNIVRAIVGDKLGIQPSSVIGTEYGYTATGQGDAQDGDYTFAATDKVVFDGQYFGENAKMSKVDAIVREIGQQPVLAFGNSSGDTAMCKYVITNNPYPARSYMVIADDEEREWGNTESAQAKVSGYTELGIGTISMKDDFAVIYGDGVQKDESAAAAGAAAAGSAGAAKTGESVETGEPEKSDQAAENAEAKAAETDKPASKDVMILYTSDVHCGVDQGFGYAGLEQVRKHLQEQGYDVILVDDGDNIQGDLIGSLTKGETPIDLMNKMGYSVAIPGNHEFDFGMEQFLALAGKAEFPYISCNFQCRGENVFDPYVIKEVGGRKIGFVGVTTPNTITSSTPRNFQDEEGNYIYSFLQDETGEALYGAVQSAVDAAREEGAEYVIVMGHLGNEEKNRPYTYVDVISHTSGIDAFLDGHSHDTDQVVMKDKEGKSVPRSACGTKLEAIGWCKISAAGEVSTGIYSWTLADAAPDLFVIENEMSAAVKTANAEVQDQLSEVIGTSTVDLTIFDPEATDSNGQRIRMVRRAETNMGDLCVDAYRARMGADVAVLGGGGVRSDIPAGEVKKSDALRVMPFGMEACKILVTGQQILDALEWGAHAVPGENGGFLQVSGMSYEIHTYIDSSCTQDTNGMFTGITGERRVKNVKIGGEPIDPEATYTLASTDYVVIQNGDGLTAFNGAERLDEGGLLEHDVLIDYIREDLGGIVGEEYSDPTGEDRIVIVEEKPAE